MGLGGCLVSLSVFLVTTKTIGEYKLGRVVNVLIKYWDNKRLDTVNHRFNEYFLQYLVSIT